MSLFRPDVWFPEFIDYQVRFFEEPIFLADYTAATMIATLFLGVQLVAGGYILRQYLIQPLLKKSRGAMRKRNHTPSDPLFYISMTIVTLYTVSVVLAWVAYGQRYSSLTRLSEFSRTREDTLQWLRDNPDHEDNMKMICIPASVGVGRQEFCKTFVLTRNLLSYKGVEMAYASVVEALIITVDGILIYRFFMMFSTARWVYPVIGILILASLAGPIVGLVSLAKLAALGTKSDPWWSANFSNKFLDWHSPWVAVALPVFVNVVVTAAIITKIARTRYRVRKLVGGFHHDNTYLTLTATLVESALPSALFGMLAAILPRVHHLGNRSGKAVSYSPTMLWVAFTALSPQFIIIRVLQGRAWTREVADSWSSPDVPLIFAHETEDTTRSTTVDSESKDML